MSYRTEKIAAAAVMAAVLTMLAPAGVADAADLPTLPVEAKPIASLPFFSLIDNRVTYSWMPKGVDPGAFSVRPNGSIDGTTATSVYSFTQYDEWAYGPNFFNISMLKSGHNDPASPCMSSISVFGGPSDCAGATEIYGTFRSTFGWNEIFNTKAFAIGPLRNISFEIGADANTENTYLAPAKRYFVAGLQFAFDLPYKGYVDIAPLVYKEINNNAFDQCVPSRPGGIAGVTCIDDGNTDFDTTGAVETNYYMDLGFLPEYMRYFSVSGRVGLIGPKGNQNSPLGLARGGTATKVELNSEPVRLIFDVSKAVWGAKYTHFLDVWVAYRYWQNKFGLDHNNAPGICTIAGPGTPSTNSCTESTVYAGVTVKF